MNSPATNNHAVQAIHWRDYLMGRDVRSRTLVRPAFKTLRITVRIGTVGGSHECCEAHVDNDVVSGVRLRTVVADGLTVGWVVEQGEFQCADHFGTVHIYAANLGSFVGYRLTGNVRIRPDDLPGAGIQRQGDVVINLAAGTG